MSFEQLKERQRLAWGAAPFERMEDSIAVCTTTSCAGSSRSRESGGWTSAEGTGAVAMRAARAGAAVTGLDLELLYDSLDPEQRDEFHRASVEMYEHDRGADGIHRERLYLLTIGRRT